MAHVRMKDVAARAGVSTATVSLVLNNTRFVSPELRQRVLEAVEALGYRPNAVARSLRRQSTRTIAVLVPTVLSPFYPAVLKQVDDAISADGLSMLFANTKESEDSERALIELMWDKRVDGLLIAPFSLANVPLLVELARKGLPVVTFHRDLAAGQLDSVTWDDFGGTREAIRHLLQTGRRRIAYLDSGERLPRATNSRSAPALLPRLRGYEAALAEAGLEPDPSLYLVGSTSEQRTAMAAGREAALRALRGPNPPDAFFAANHYMAIGVLGAAAEAGVPIPEALAVIGYDDHPWTEQLAPPLSVVSRDPGRLGATAAELLLRRLAGQAPEGGVETIVLPTRLVVRASSAPTPARLAPPPTLTDVNSS